MVNELRTSITQQVIRKDTGDKLQAFAISMFFKGKSNQSSRIQDILKGNALQTFDFVSDSFHNVFRVECIATAHRV